MNAHEELVTTMLDDLPDAVETPDPSVIRSEVARRAKVRTTMQRLGAVGLFALLSIGAFAAFGLDDDAEELATASGDEVAAETTTTADVPEAASSDNSFSVGPALLEPGSWQVEVASGHLGQVDGGNISIWNDSGQHFLQVVGWCEQPFWEIEWVRGGFTVLGEVLPDPEADSAPTGPCDEEEQAISLGLPLSEGQQVAVVVIESVDFIQAQLVEANDLWSVQIRKQTRTIDSSEQVVPGPETTTTEPAGTPATDPPVTTTTDPPVTTTTDPPVTTTVAPAALNEPATWLEFSSWDPKSTLYVDGVATGQLGVLHECFDGECGSPMDYWRTDDFVIPVGAVVSFAGLDHSPDVIVVRKLTSDLAFDEIGGSSPMVLTEPGTYHVDLTVDANFDSVEGRTQVRHFLFLEVVDQAAPCVSAGAARVVVTGAVDADGCPSNAAKLNIESLHPDFHCYPWPATIEVDTQTYLRDQFSPTIEVAENPLADLAATGAFIEIGEVLVSSTEEDAVFVRRSDGVVEVWRVDQIGLLCA